MKARTEMLAFLHSINVGILSAIETYDMGMQIEFVTPEGFGESFGNMGQMPTHVICGVTQDQLNLISQKALTGDLSLNDISNTSFGEFYDYIFDGRSEEDIIPPNEFFKGLPDVKVLTNGKVYVLCDGGQYEPEAAFYANYESLEAAFVMNYLDCVTPWDTLNDDELEKWCEKLDGNPQTVECNCFGAPDD